MFIDTAKVKIEAGKGGDGAISFRHEIYIPKGGPDGGDGGKGGDVIFRASRNANTLANFRFQPELKAESGKSGSGQRSTGKSGADLIVEVPVGTIVWKLDGDEKTQVADLTADSQETIVAHGGTGGFGNNHFKSSIRQTPKIAERGELGEAFPALLELKSIADVGLVGLPNAGKSTFLSVVSNARPEIADYPFTTLTPSLGVATIDDTDILIADIPGLIEGASVGKGLGTAFLRHIERTSILLHLIDAYSEDVGVAYSTIRKELKEYSSDLAARPEIVALTKAEGFDHDLLKLQMASVLAINPSAEIYPISAQSHEGLTDLLRALRVKTKASTQGVVAKTADLCPPSGCRRGVGSTPTSSLAATTATREDRLARVRAPGDKESEFLHNNAEEPLPVITLTPRKKRPTHALIDQSYDDETPLRRKKS